MERSKNHIIYTSTQTHQDEIIRYLSSKRMDEMLQYTNSFSRPSK